MAVGGGEDDLGPPHVLLGTVPVCHDCLEAAAVAELTQMVIPCRMAQGTTSSRRAGML